MRIYMRTATEFVEGHDLVLFAGSRRELLSEQRRVLGEYSDDEVALGPIELHDVPTRKREMIEWLRTSLGRTASDG